MTVMTSGHRHSISVRTDGEALRGINISMRREYARLGHRMRR
jgi:hypothetical protein